MSSEETTTAASRRIDPHVGSLSPAALGCTSFEPIRGDQPQVGSRDWDHARFRGYRPPTVTNKAVSDSADGQASPGADAARCV